MKLGFVDNVFDVTLKRSLSHKWAVKKPPRSKIAGKRMCDVIYLHNLTSTKSQTKKTVAKAP